MASDEAACGQFLHQGPVDSWRSREVEVGQALLAVAAGLGQVPGQAGLIPTFQLVIQQEGQKLKGGQLTLRGLGSSDIEGQHHGRELELAQLGEERMTDHLLLPSAEMKKSALGLAKANVREGKLGTASGSGSWSRAAFRICLIRR